MLLFFFLILILGWANPQKNNFGVWFDTYNVYSDIPRWISLSVYLSLSFKLVREVKSNNEIPPSTIKWLREFLFVLMAFDFLWLLYLIPYVMPAFTDQLLNLVDWYPLYLPVAIIIYWLGIRGLLIGRKEMSSLTRSMTVKTNLPEESVTQILNGLGKLMRDDKLYRDPDLSLSTLAVQLGTTSRNISIVLNRKLGKSFNEYVNQFRVEEVKDRLLRSENKNYTIAALAYECGFNSQPTFQRAFKNIVGITPSEFLRRNVADPPPFPIQK